MNSEHADKQAPTYWWLLLLLGSYGCYAYLNPFSLVYLAASTLAVYWVARVMDGKAPGRQKKWLLIAGLGAGLSFLLVFKYSDFLGRTLTYIKGLFSTTAPYEPLGFVLPLGISFYTFKLVSYLVDVYHERVKAERHLGYLALYTAFFPQILAGPIDRAAQFIPQLKKRVHFDYDRVTGGFRLLAWGLFKKLVIADSLAILVNHVYGDVHRFTGPPLLIAAVAYSFQIYCDFSGYSDIAIGVARILGYRSMKNFDSPYAAKSITKFWNAWHISLSTWLRDYLFLPITYAVMRRIKTPRLAKIKAETWGYVIGMSVTMFLGGLWHGAAWTFVIWGALHGLFLVLSYTTKKARKRWVKRLGLKRYPRLHNFLKITSTFSLVTLAWVFFRAESVSDAFYVITHLHVDLFSYLGNIIETLLFNLSLKPLDHLLKALDIAAFDLNKVIIAITLMEWIQWLQRRTGSLEDRFKAQPLWLRWSCYFILLSIIVYWGKYDVQEFIYFQF